MHQPVREIRAAQISDLTDRLFREACAGPMLQAQEELDKAARAESCDHAREILKQILENNEAALQTGLPACQDTGMAAVYLDIGQDVHIVGGDLSQAIAAGVRKAYAEGRFRASVADPLSRMNTGNNLPPVIVSRIVPGDQIRMRALPKGFGSENMSALAMLKPSDGREGVMQFIVERTMRAGGSPCPPVFLGVGVGGTFDSCALLSRYALLDMFSPRTDGELAEMESELLRRINATGMGPMGLGGDAYCLGVRIEKEPTHIAGLPVAVNFCCHMLRMAEGWL